MDLLSSAWRGRGRWCCCWSWVYTQLSSTETESQGSISTSLFDDDNAMPPRAYPRSEWERKRSGMSAVEAAQCVEIADQVLAPS